MNAECRTVIALSVLLLLPGVSSAVESADPRRVAGRDPLSHVSVARSGEEARDLLAAELPKAGGRILLVSPHDYLSSLILPLAREGALKELVAVLPSDNVLGPEHLEQVRAFQDRAGVPEEDRDSLVLANGSIQGSIRGVPFQLHTLTSLPSGKGEDLLLVVDTSFLPAVYRNEVKTPMVDLAWKLMLTLADRKVFAGRAVVFDATGREDFPLEQGFLASLVREMLSDPSRFSGSLPERWELLKAADSAYFFAQYADGMALFRRYLEQAPGDASACYKVAMMAARDLDVGMTLHWLNKAVEVDPLYRRAYSEAAGYLYRKELLESAEQVLLAGLSRFPEDPLLATNLSALYTAQGDSFRDAGDVAGAAAFYGLAGQVEGADPQVRGRAKSMADSLSNDLPK